MSEELTEEAWEKKYGEARDWFNMYILSQEEFETVCTLEGCDDSTWNKHIEFVAECLAAGVKPIHFADTVIACQKAYNDGCRDGDPFDGLDLGEETE